MAKRKRVGRRAVGGVVTSFDENAGWGVISSPDVPGGCFVHYSAVQMDGYRFLRSGQSVQFTFEQLGYLQDGYRFRAIEVRLA